jgi:Ni/Fe-hydrogenase subunit HybB-like protein
MNTQQSQAYPISRGERSFWKFYLNELKPKGKLFTPFNIISIPTILIAIVILVIRFSKGLGSVSNFSQDHPWGIWINFNVITGVAFAGGAYVVTFLVYILKLKKYYPIIRAAVLMGFLAYVFYAGALLLDLGRPWKVINPIIGNSFGFSSVLFLVAWHFLLYMIAELIEFSPAIAEWAGWKRLRKIMASMTLGAVILGITLSTLHQSGLGALFLMSKWKIHPLWYTEFIPHLFFISSIFAGLSLLIVEGSISRLVFKNSMDSEHRNSHHEIVMGLAKICGIVMVVYLFAKVLIIIHGNQWSLIATPMGYWFLLEVLGFVLVPCILFINGLQKNNIVIVRIAAVLAMIGIILNRLNISTFAYKWEEGVHFPSWQELVVLVAIIFVQLWVFRWIVRRMPVYRASPSWVNSH